MSSLTGGEIYTGAWTDWSRGAILGSTITLSDRWGAVLTAFLSFFVTIVGACLWRILCFIIHQCSASPDARDGMHHQHQLIFRNTSSPTEAVRAFFENAFFWRKNGRRAWSRSLPLSIFALLFMLGFATASLLTSLVTKASGSQRLIISSNCGFFGLDPLSDNNTRTRAMASKDLNDTVTAAAYARSCYDGGYKANKLQCSTFTTPQIDWTSSTDAECPFHPSMCVGNDVYKLDTGFINTHTDLGINSHHRARVHFRKVTTCAPLRQQGHVQVVNSTGLDGLGQEGDTIREYQYGTFIDIGMDANTTYYYNQHAYIDGFGYELNSYIGYPESSAWLPLPEIYRDDADVSLVFLAPNAIKFEEPNSDPFFSANFKVDLPSYQGVSSSYYSADKWVNVLGCTDQYQFCDPEDSNRCTPLTGYMQAWTSINATGMNSVQSLVANRIALNLRSLSINHSIGGRGAAALRAQELVNDRTQGPIPDNQWQIEVSNWFAIALAKLQRQIVEYASGPSDVPEGTYVQKPLGPISEAMCSSQKVAMTSTTVSFSVLGLALILCVGAVVIFVYLILESAVSFLQKRFHWGDYRRLRWVMDDKIQLQRMAFEEAGMGGTWANLTGNVPVSEKGQVFGGLNHVDPEEPRLRTQWKTKVQNSSASSTTSGTQMQNMPAYDSGKLGVAAIQQPVYHALTPPMSQGQFQ